MKGPVKVGASKNKLLDQINIIDVMPSVANLVRWGVTESLEGKIVKVC